MEQYDDYTKPTPGMIFLIALILAFIGLFLWAIVEFVKVVAG